MLAAVNLGLTHETKSRVSFVFWVMVAVALMCSVLVSVFMASFYVGFNLRAIDLHRSGYRDDITRIPPSDLQLAMRLGFGIHKGEVDNTYAIDDDRNAANVVAAKSEFQRQVLDIVSWIQVLDSIALDNVIQDADLLQQQQRQRQVQQQLQVAEQRDSLKPIPSFDSDYWTTCLNDPSPLRMVCPIAIDTIEWRC
jgi:hypothetical protein